MNKKLPIISLFFMSIVSLLYWALKPKEDLYEAKWNAPDTTLAITINGEISTTFPTTNMYTGTVECTNGTGKVEWNGVKWILTTSGITTGGTKCNVTFITRVPTLAEVILANNEIKTPITTPGAAISTASEALLASAEDDYGTSYYFRGAVTNNYVEFANKCWRIVRVGGDGSVKLILHNDNTAGAANPCNSANNGNIAAFARNSDKSYKSEFNSHYDDNTYVGFKYGTAGSNTYAATHANTNKSTILTYLETWYTNNLKTYESVIDNSVWCNDKTNVTDTTYNPWNYSNVNGLGYGTNVTYYGATQRLVSKSGSAGGTGPSLKCNGELSKINSKVGLITADELALAGYATLLQNSTTYLQENATYTYWWSLSPDHIADGMASIWCVANGDFAPGYIDVRGDFGYFGVNSDGGVRPAISLISSITISGGFGTSEDPYVVK